MNNIEISYENIINELDNKIIVKTCNNILKLLKVDNWEISLVFCDDVFIRNLNRDFRNKDESTDVLSFPTERWNRNSGDGTMNHAGIKSPEVIDNASYPDI